MSQSQLVAAVHPAIPGTTEADPIEDDTSPSPSIHAGQTGPSSVSQVSDMMDVETTEGAQGSPVPRGRGQKPKKKKTDEPVVSEELLNLGPNSHCCISLRC